MAFGLPADRRRRGDRRLSEVAASWYPVNYHPLDKASYSFAVIAPAGWTAIANGVPAGHTAPGGSDHLAV